MLPASRARRPRARPHRRGFIILFGARRIISNDAVPGGLPVRTVCPRCSQEVGFLAKGYRTWFTLFFVPIFPISGKTRFTECPQCGAQFQVSPEELRAQIGA